MLKNVLKENNKIFQILVGTEEVSFAIMKALEEIYVIQAGGNVQMLADMAKGSVKTGEHGHDENYLLDIEETFDKSSSDTSEPKYFNYYPLTNLLAQLECVLQMSQCILRIERICSVAKHPTKNKK